MTQMRVEIEGSLGARDETHLRSVLADQWIRRRAAVRKRRRPLALDSPLQSYFVDANFAAAATSEVFNGVGAPDGFPSLGVLSR